MEIPYQPDATGVRALDELGRVDWGQLAHAYGAGVIKFRASCSLDIAGDVCESLILLPSDPQRAIAEGLYSNICHQGTVYEATAYAVPFITAVAAGDVPDGVREQLVALLGDIAIGGSYVAPQGSHAGALDAHVGRMVTDSLAMSIGRLSAIEAPAVAAVVAELKALLAEPTDERRGAVDAAIDALLCTDGP